MRTPTSGGTASDENSGTGGGGSNSGTVGSQLDAHRTQGAVTRGAWTLRMLVVLLVAVAVVAVPTTLR